MSTALETAYSSEVTAPCIIAETHVPAIAESKNALQDRVRYSESTWKMCITQNSGEFPDQLRSALESERTKVEQWVERAECALQASNQRLNKPTEERQQYQEDGIEYGWTTAPIFGLHSIIPAAMEEIPNTTLEMLILLQRKALALSVRLKARQVIECQERQAVSCDRELFALSYTLQQAQGSGCTGVENASEVVDCSNALAEWRYRQELIQKELLSESKK